MGWWKDAVLAGIAGYGGGRVMNTATTLFQERQSASSRQRERELQGDLPTTVLVKKVADWWGANLDDDRAERMGSLVHQGLAVWTGLSAVVLMRRGMAAIPAGLTAAMSTWFVADELINPILGLTPPATEYPLVTHMRGLGGHVVLGLAVGTFLAIGRWIWPDDD
jgi:hypothetical protein